MPRAKHTFGPVFKNADPAAVPPGFAVEAFNCYPSAAGSLTDRPGHLPWLDLNTGRRISGLYWWEQKRAVAVTSGSSAFLITSPSGSLQSISGGNLLLDQRPTFAEDRTRLYLANGSRIHYTDGSVPLEEITDPDAPLQVTHVAFLDGYLLAFQRNGRIFQHSLLDDSLSWNALDQFLADGLIDKLVALVVAHQRIYAFGTKSVEVWFNDGVTPFRRNSNTLIQRGTLSPHTIALANNTFYFLDQERRFVRLQGLTPQVVSTAYDRELRTFGTVEDAIFNVYNIRGKNWLVMSFPTEGRTIAYDYLNDQFDGDWSLWDQANGRHTEFLGQTHVHVPDWNMHIVGDRSTGKLYQMSESAYNDAGQIMARAWEGPPNDQGTLANKSNEWLRARLKRGQTDLPVNPVVQLRWRDSNGLLSLPQPMDLGALGQGEDYLNLPPMGDYISRALRLEWSDNAPVEIYSLEEQFEFEE
jgi:hypothetical protein